MLLVPRVRALLLHGYKIPLYSCSLHTISPAVKGSTCKENDAVPKPEVGSENESLLERLTIMGVDVKMVRRRQPGVLRKIITNEHGLSHFLKAKGASRETIAGIISRFPRAITRSEDHLAQRWALWRSVFKSDDEIVSILDRSPESFFRSSDNDNLEKNIQFLSSLGLGVKELHGLLTTAPRTFSNSVELNQQMVEFLENAYTDLGGKKDPGKFAKALITKNPYILIRSTKRVGANIDFLRTSLKLEDSDLLTLLQHAGAEVLDLSCDYLKRNFQMLERRLLSEGCKASDITAVVMSYPAVLYIGPETLSQKLDCLLNGGVRVGHILEKPKVLEYSMVNLKARLEELRAVGYDFEEGGIAILDSSRKRFDAKVERLRQTNQV